MNINDNVYKNFESTISVSFFDEDIRFLKKEEITKEEKEEMVDNIVDTMEDDNWQMKSVDKILLCHRNTKLFLIMMTGPFLIGAKAIWYIFKLAILKFLYDSTKKK